MIYKQCEDLTATSRLSKTNLNVIGANDLYLTLLATILSVRSLTCCFSDSVIFNFKRLHLLHIFLAVSCVLLIYSTVSSSALGLRCMFFRSR